MKAILFLPLLITTGFFVRPVHPDHSINQVAVADSNNIVHVLDGTVKEWPSNKFLMDDGTHIEYAIDNDSKNLYIAMNVSDNRMQIKMMRLGMSTYIDLKAKKKEGRGIEFPEKNEAPENTFQVRSGSRSGQAEDGQPQPKPDMKKIRMMMALNMNRLKLFGFGKDEPEDQQLLLPGSVNIAFTWDSTDVMHIEYVVPLALLGDAASLNQKEIAIGWNIHPFEMPKREGGGEGGGMNGGGYGGGGRRGYGGGGYRSGGGGSGDAAEERAKMMEAQRFWAKYTVVIPTEKKAF